MNKKFDLSYLKNWVEKIESLFEHTEVCNSAFVEVANVVELPPAGYEAVDEVAVIETPITVLEMMNLTTEIYDEKAHAIIELVGLLKAAVYGKNKRLYWRVKPTIHSWTDIDGKPRGPMKRFYRGYTRLAVM